MVPPLSDDVQLTVDEYRNKLYEYMKLKRHKQCFPIRPKEELKQLSAIPRPKSIVKPKEVKIKDEIPVKVVKAKKDPREKLDREKVTRHQSVEEIYNRNSSHAPIERTSVSDVNCRHSYSNSTFSGNYGFKFPLVCVNCELCEHKMSV